tara:strand:- start:593 stop:2884 length:2292 start_codon:yes stop_codon:yes gene_type:complete
MPPKNTGFEQPRVPSGASPRERRGQALLGGNHSVLKELGIGTNDPDSALHIVKETAGAGLTLERIQDSVNSASVQSKKSRGTLDNRAAVADDDDLLTIRGFAYVGDNNSYQETCRIEYEVDGSVSDASKGAPGRIVFRTSSGSGLTKRMRITKDGNVGIGLDDPSTKLTVEGAITMKEQAAADTDAAAYGQVWVKTATPNELYFTTDAGNDIQITSGTSLAGGSGGGGITGVTIQTDSGSGSKATDTSGSADFILQGDSAGIDVTNSGTTITVALDLNEITAGAVADGDSFVFVDANDSNANKKEAIADLATLFAGDGLTASSSVLAVNVDDSTIETNSDAIRIKDGGVTYAKIQNVSATDRILGRDSSGAGAIEEITPANLRTMINVADGATAVTTENIQDIVGAMFSSNTETRISATYQNGDGTIDLVVDDMTANTMGSGFVLEDGDGTEVTITENKEVKIVEGTGIDVDWTDTDNGTDGDPYDLTISCDLEGTELKSTGETGGSKFLREDGDGTCSWQTVSGGGISWDGSTAQGVATFKDSDEATVEANLTFDGNSLLCVTGSASAVPCTIKGAASQSVDLLQFQDNSGDNLLMIDQGGSIRLGLGGDREIHVEPESGTNRAGKDIFIKGGKSTGNGEGGDIRFYTSPVGSSGSSVNGWAEVLKIRHDKKLDFKITAEDEDDLDLESSEHKWLPIQVGGVDYFLPLYREEPDPGGCTWTWNYNYEQYQLTSSDCAAGYECPYFDVNTYQGVTVNRPCQES